MRRRKEMAVLRDDFLARRRLFGFLAPIEFDHGVAQNFRIVDEIIADNGADLFGLRGREFCAGGGQSKACQAEAEKGRRQAGRGQGFHRGLQGGRRPL